jgi:hypothetical protein
MLRSVGEIAIIVGLKDSLPTEPLAYLMEYFPPNQYCLVLARTGSWLQLDAHLHFDDPTFPTWEPLIFADSILLSSAW